MRARKNAKTRRCKIWKFGNLEIGRCRVAAAPALPLRVCVLHFRIFAFSRFRIVCVLQYSSCHPCIFVFITHVAVLLYSPPPANRLCITQVTSIIILRTCVNSYSLPLCPLFCTLCFTLFCTSLHRPTRLLCRSCAQFHVLICFDLFVDCFFIEVPYRYVVKSS